MKRIAIFASGDGSNAEAIARYFASSDKICVKCVLSNRQNARVHDRMSAIGISSITFSKASWQSATEIVEYLDQEQIDLIVLAGFMSKIEPPIISAYNGRIINIHPSLLPRHGGPGMWGRHVHEAVISSGDSQSGITIHYVTEEIDGGEIIFQASCDVASDDTPETLAEKIHELEHRYFPKVIEHLLQ
ncbi:MAG: phosphoribosylglycinamide formyltransferase [Muribaculaceae bacterium]|nr:phosphoribosylglycinamide formyltransferase [Muribaculaceae bacterium]